MKKRINLLREFSVPLIAGVIVALVWANLPGNGYRDFINAPVFGTLSLEFITNDIFMVFFFGIAAVEITLSCLPGGALNPPLKAVNPLLSTLGGVLGPALIYLTLNYFFGSRLSMRGWGIPTATDIAFAWLAARLIFGNNHPVISFLLLLAIADDAIGLVIIALFYPDPSNPVLPAWLALTLAGMAVSFFLRGKMVRNYWPYLVLGGILSWTGLIKAHLHPALALVFIVPFMPYPVRSGKHVFDEDPRDLSTLSRFERDWKVIVDFGLFLFGLANAGVAACGIQALTWIVFFALLFGKSLGIFSMGWAAERLGFPLPKGMDKRHLLVAGVISGTGFTVALFMCGVAFSAPDLQAAAKIGAMLSLFSALVAALVARALKIGRTP